MQNGTLTKEHVETLDAVYPTVASELRKRVYMTAGQPESTASCRAEAESRSACSSEARRPHRRRSTNRSTLRAGSRVERAARR